MRILLCAFCIWAEVLSEIVLLCVSGGKLKYVVSDDIVSFSWTGRFWNSRLMEGLGRVQLHLICCQYALFLEGDGLVCRKERGRHFLKMCLGASKSRPGVMLDPEERKQNWPNSLGSWAMALESDRPGFESWLCHLQVVNVGKWLHLFEPQFSYLLNGDNTTPSGLLCVTTSDNKTPRPIIPLSELNSQLPSPLPWPLANKWIYIFKVYQNYFMLYYFPIYYFSLSCPSTPKNSKLSSIPLVLKHLEDVHPFLTSISPEYQQHYKGSGVFRIKKSGRLFPPRRGQICQTLVPSPPVNGENRGVGATNCLTSLHFGPECIQVRMGWVQVTIWGF